MDFEEIKEGASGPGKLRRVISVRGSTSIKNLQDSTDTAFEFDDKLGINVHRGESSSSSIYDFFD